MEKNGSTEECGNCNIILKKPVLVSQVREFEHKKSLSFQCSLGINMIRAFLKAYEIDKFLKLKIIDPVILYPITMDLPCKLLPSLNSDERFLLLESENFRCNTISNYHFKYKNKIKTPRDIIVNLFDILDKCAIKNIGAISSNHVTAMLKQAEASTLRYENNAFLSIIDGVPFFVSEEFKLNGQRSQLGSSEYFIDCTETAEAVEKLCSQGAICCGYTNITQFSISQLGINQNHLDFGTKNPKNKNYYASGGSPGNSAAVAMGLVPFTLGFDKLGSLRTSSGACGIVGLKPTYGRISSKGMMSSYTCPFWQIGPMANCVRDSLIVYSFLTSSEDYDIKKVPFVPPFIIPNLTMKSLQGIKFGVCPQYINFADKLFVENFLGVLDKIYYMNGEIVRISLPELKETMIAAFMGEARSVYQSTLFQFDETIMDTKDLCSNFIIALGKSINELDMNTINRQRSRSMNIMKDIFKKVDIIMILNSITFPKLIVGADKIRETFDDYQMMSSYFYQIIPSLTGLPSITININNDKTTSLPISIQLIGRWWEENLLIEATHLMESVLDSSDKSELFICPMSLGLNESFA